MEVRYKPWIVLKWFKLWCKITLILVCFSEKSDSIIPGKGERVHLLHVGLHLVLGTEEWSWLGPSPENWTVLEVWDQFTPHS